MILKSLFPYTISRIVLVYQAMVRTMISSSPQQMVYPDIVVLVKAYEKDHVP